jgi:tetratricopeptide (TPR) repeat protein
VSPTARRLSLVLILELLVVFVTVAWRMSRPSPPEVNLSRLPPSTADAVRSLQAAVWTDTAAGWQELGEAYLGFGYFSEAEVCLRRAAQQAPLQYTPVFEHAYSLERMGRLTEANEQFAAAARVATGREAQACYFRIARNALRLDDVAAAESAFAKAPTLPVARCARARFLIRTGRAAEALPILTQLREEIGLDIHTEMATARACRELNLPREEALAVQRAERARRRFEMTDHSTRLDAIRMRYGLSAELLTLSRRPAEAASGLDRFFADVPFDFMENLFSTGVRLDLMAKRPQAALERLDQLATRMDLPPELKRLRGIALAEAGQHDRAIEQWTQVNELQPSAETHRALAELLAHRGEPAREREERAKAQLQQAVDAYHADDLKAALTELEALQSISPDDPRLWYYLGLTRSALDGGDDARQAFSRCLELNPRHGRARQQQRVLLEK